MEAILVIIGLVVLFSIIGWVAGLWSRAKKYDELKPRLDNLDAYNSELQLRESELKSREESIEVLIKEQSEGFPSLAEAYAEHLHLQDLKRADYLQRKYPPALSAAQHLREVALQRKVAEERYRVLKYQLERYEALFPWLVDFKDVDIDNLRKQIAERGKGAGEKIGKLEDSAKEESRQAEYDRLSTLGKYQVLLELFWQAKKRSEEEVAIEILAKEKSQGFPWLAQAYSEYFHLQDLKTADYLQCKSPPAPKAAEEVRAVAAQRRIAEKLYRVLKYQLEYYERLFPWLIDFKGEDVDDLIIQIMEKGKQRGQEIEGPEDPIIVHTTEGERKTLSRQELFQRALDRWWRKPKTKWQVGRDYERYIGYLYESRGYSVYYQGIVEGLADLGRDLICVKDNIVEVVQCKYWSKEKQIHEKHIFQLYGTVIAYRLDNSKKHVSACFVTSTSLSDRAHQFARELKIKTTENYPLKHYPCIKCNVSRRDGTKIYHLPFDQQYDRTLVEEERNECYVETVAEAEALGFRRAFRWRGEAQE